MTRRTQKLSKRRLPVWLPCSYWKLNLSQKHRTKRHLDIVLRFVCFWWDLFRTHRNIIISETFGFCSRTCFSLRRHRLFSKIRPGRIINSALTYRRRSTWRKTCVACRREPHLEVLRSPLSFDGTPRSWFWPFWVPLSGSFKLKLGPQAASYDGKTWRQMVRVQNGVRFHFSSSRVGCDCAPSRLLIARHALQ